MAIGHLGVIEEDQIAERAILLFLDARQVQGRGCDREPLAVALDHNAEGSSGRRSTAWVDLMGSCERQTPSRGTLP